MIFGLLKSPPGFFAAGDDLGCAVAVARFGEAFVDGLVGLDGGRPVLRFPFIAKSEVNIECCTVLRSFSLISLSYLKLSIEIRTPRT
jgi:hypothetical protein